MALKVVALKVVALKVVALKVVVWFPCLCMYVELDDSFYVYVRYSILHMQLKRRNSGRCRGRGRYHQGGGGQILENIISDLIFAIHQRNYSKVIQIINTIPKNIKVDVNVAMDNGRSAPIFTKAILSGDKDIVEYLLEHCDADIHVLSGTDKETPLHTAAYLHNDEIIQIIIDHGIKTHENMSKMVNAKDINGRTPLHRLMMTRSYPNSDTKSFNILYTYGADVDAQDTDGNTPLHLAVLNGKTYMVTLLLESAARFDIKNKQDELAAEITPPVSRSMFVRLNAEDIISAKKLISEYKIPSFGFKAFRKEADDAIRLQELTLAKRHASRPKSKKAAATTIKRRAKSSPSSTTSSSIESSLSSSSSSSTSRSRAMSLKSHKDKLNLSSVSPLEADTSLSRRQASSPQKSHLRSFPLCDFKVGSAEVASGPKGTDLRGTL